MNSSNSILRREHFGRDHHADLDKDRLIETIDTKLFDEIYELMDKLEHYDQEEEKCKRKIEKYNQAIESAEEMVKRAEEKQADLIKRNEFLKTCLEQREEKKRQALKYWEDYGINVRQISRDEDDFQQYEFIYSKLSNKKTEQNKVAGEQDDGQAEPTDGQCSINLKYHDKKLKIVEPVPEFISSEHLSELNSRLTNNCVNVDTDFVDYRLAMIMIKKEIIKYHPSLAKTCEHPPAETSSHTCT